VISVIIPVMVISFRIIAGAQSTLPGHYMPGSIIYFYDIRNDGGLIGAY